MILYTLLNEHDRVGEPMVKKLNKGTSLYAYANHFVSEFRNRFHIPEIDAKGVNKVFEILGIPSIHTDKGTKYLRKNIEPVFTGGYILGDIKNGYGSGQRRINLDTLKNEFMKLYGIIDYKEPTVGGEEDMETIDTPLNRFIKTSKGNPYSLHWDKAMKDASEECLKAQDVYYNESKNCKKIIISEEQRQFLKTKMGLTSAE